MNPHRQAMEKALKAVFGPGIRARGFVGTWPNLRRTVGERLDLINIQFSSSSDRFYLNLGQAPAHGFTQGPSTGLPVEKITANHCLEWRRLNPKPTGWLGTKAHNGFEFGPRYSDSATPLKSPKFYEELATEVLKRFDETGEEWLADPRRERRREG